MAAPTTARSGFLDTMPSPLVRIAGSMVEDDVDSDGEPVKTTGRPKVMTSAAMITEQVTAIPSVTRLTRISSTQRSRHAGALLAATAAIYGASVAAGTVAFRRLVDPKQISGKVAGGLLYAFALITLLTDAYVPLLLTVAALALAVSSAEGIVAAITTIHERASASRTRCQTPQALKDVAFRIGAESSNAASATPAANEMRR